MHFCKYLIIFSFVFFPSSLMAQDITGLWKGTLYNDSTQKFYRYEIGISEEKGKLTGFSHTFFLDGDKEFYGVKKVKIKRTDGKIIIEDAGLIANNYPIAPAKGVRQLNVLELEMKDSIMKLTGPFTTNRTKEYAPLTGTISLQRKNDFWQSALVPHLQELGLSKELSFVKKEDDQIKEAEAKKNAEKEVAVNTKPTVTEKETVVEKTATAKTEASKATAPVKKADAAQQKNPALKEDHPAVINEEKEIAKAAVENEPVAKVEKQVIKKIIPPAADVDIRTTVLQQTVYFNSDSLQISLYDNGEVDGDTVSVLMNGKIIMAKEGLSTKAVQKTIYADQGNDNIELVMYAENLGAIAPNTGLLVVHDGKSIYEIRFSGDLQKNASIILRRRKN